jgi:hypothetical protein
MLDGCAQQCRLSLDLGLGRLFPENVDEVEGVDLDVSLSVLVRGCYRILYSPCELAISSALSNEALMASDDLSVKLSMVMMIGGWMWW